MKKFKFRWIKKIWLVAVVCFFLQLFGCQSQSDDKSITLEFTESPWKERCGSITPYEIDNNMLPYRLVGYLAGVGGQYKVIEQDFTTTDLDLKGNDPYSLHVSPNSQWLSYWTTDIIDGEEQFVSIEFLSPALNEHFSVEWQKNWIPTSSSPWFDSQHITFSEIQGNGDENNKTILSLTGENMPMVWENLPDIITKDSHLSVWINPLLTHAAYQKEPYIVGDRVISNLAVWDIDDEDLIWESPDELAVDYNSIVWSPDSQKVAFLARSFDSASEYPELYILTLDEDLQRKTYFEEHFEAYTLTSLVWSQDSNRLLFAFGDHGQKNESGTFSYKPLMLELFSNEIVSLCLSSFNNFHTDQPFSLDSKFLVVVGTIDEGTNDQVLLVDISTGDVQILPIEVCTTSNCDEPDDIDLTGILGWISQTNQ